MVQLGSTAQGLNKGAPLTRRPLAQSTEAAMTRVEHRHPDQKPEDPNLVLEVGNPVPPFYRRAAGLSVQNIEDGDPIICTLSDGDKIYVGQHRVVR